MDAGLDGAGPVQDAKSPSDYEYIKNDIGDFGQGFGEGHQDARDSRRFALPRPVRIGVDELAPVLKDAVVTARGNEPSPGRGDQHQAEKEDVGVGDPGFHLGPQ